MKKSAIQKVKLLLLVLIIQILSLNGQAQEASRNFGLRIKQETATLPKSRAPFGKAIPVGKRKIQAKLEKITDHEYRIADGWEMNDALKVTASQVSPLKEGINTADWYNAVVPGTVLTTLVKSGVYPDPYWGLNNLVIPDSLCRMDWWYRVEFFTPESNVKELVQLVFEGINYRAEVWLNGKLLGNIKGAFTRGIFDVTGILKSTGANVLAVKILPPYNPGIPSEQSMAAGAGPNGGQLCLDGPTFISSEGWDWVPGIRDRNIGIWQDVKLCFAGNLKIGDSQIITDLPLPDTTSVDITLKTSLINTSPGTLKGELTFAFDQISVKKEVLIPPKSAQSISFTPEEFKHLTFKNPKLWWPNGYGVQNLYQATITAKLEGRESDKKTIRFGVREFTYDLTVQDQSKKFIDISFNPTAAYKSGKPVFDILNKVYVDTIEKVFVPKLLPVLPHEGISVVPNTASPFLVLRVNGVKVFMKGGNWGMDDAMKNVSRAHLEPYLKLHKEQNFNMLRNWTGESTEDMLYELCDEYGILVLNDFWLSTADYNLLVNDYDLTLKNMKEVITRYRNHPSLALWCPRNEGFIPDVLETGLSQLIAEVDGTRHYIGSSIRLNTTGSGPWGPRNPKDNFSKKISRGFDTEVGAPSVPTAESMRKMMAEEDLWPIGDVWSYHDWHVGPWLHYEQGAKAIDYQYGASNNVDEFCKKAQLVNYDAYRSIFEAFNSRLWHNTTGVLLWMSHPAWPSLSWQTYSWDYETPGAYFGSKKACEPLHIQMRGDDYKVQVINNHNKDFEGLSAVCEVYDLAGKRISSRSLTLNAAANSAADCFVVEEPANVADIFLVRLKLIDKGKRIVSANDYWQTKKGKTFAAFNSLPNAALKISSFKKMASGTYRFTIKNEGMAIALSVRMNVRNSVTGKALLPAYFSDGYFNLLPGEARELTVGFNEMSDKQSITVEGYNFPIKELHKITI